MINEEYCLQKNISHSSLLIPHLIIPNGKGKVQDVINRLYTMDSVSIPNGKGKERENKTKTCPPTNVSIPNGKGKVLIEITMFFLCGLWYQFPMGKVKSISN